MVSLLEKDMKKTHDSFFDAIEDKVKECTQFTTENMKSYQEVRANYFSLVMYREVIKMAKEKYSEAETTERDKILRSDEEGKDSKQEKLINEDANEDMASIATTNVAGVIDKSDVLRLQRLIFRATRGKAICMTEDVDPEVAKSEGIRTPKTKYLVIFQSGDFLNHRVKTICDSFMGDTFDLPRREEFDDKLRDITTKITDAKQILQKTREEIRNYYVAVNKIKGSEYSAFKVYEMYTKKEMIIYRTMNKLVPENQLLHGYFWSDLNKKKAHDRIYQIQSKYRFEGLQAIEMTDQVEMTPPTKIQTNDFIESFQQIVNTYGVPSYKEVNPAFFTIITFPFLFGVMFGDVAHGFLLFCASAYLCMFKEQIEKSDSMFKALLSARYLLLLMGFFGTFCGLMYNDMMAIPIEGFGGSCYREDSNTPEPDCVYPFGVDPRWYRSSLAITFVNSLKMKLSVIFAIAQMSLGVCIKAFNAAHFRSAVDFVFEFIPQIVLMLSLFGYMDALIIIKWLTDFKGRENRAPSIINTMINIPLKGAYIEGDAFISDQKTNQNISLVLLLIAVICIPIMLIPKPIILISRLDHHEDEEHGEQKKSKVVPSQEDEPSGDKQYNKLGDGEEAKEGNDKESNKKSKGSKKDQNENSSEADQAREFKKKSDIALAGPQESHSGSEIVIHQLIETIEFVLGTISNTASYLRLWALSLAHSQLAGVFFELTLWPGIKAENPISIFIGLLVWGSATFAVLMCMDLMECFLHTLRLHWVEFQNKFYRGGGILFNPLNFEEIHKE